MTPEQRADVEGVLRGVEGVVSVHNPDDRPHLTIVGYRPDVTDTQALLQGVRAQGVHAELVGL
nr:ATP-binding protein [Thiocystis violacea]